MFVCVCGQVTDKTIYDAALNGANRLKDMQPDIPVAMNCRRCLKHATAVLRQGIEHRTTRSS